MTPRQLASARHVQRLINERQPGDFIEIEQRQLHAVMQALWCAVERVAELEGRRERRLVRRAEGRALTIFHPASVLADSEQLGPDFVGQTTALLNE